MATNKLDELIAVLEAAYHGSAEALSTVRLPNVDPNAQLESTSADSASRSAIEYPHAIVTALPAAASVGNGVAVGDAQSGAATLAGATANAEFTHLTNELEMLRRVTSQHAETLQGNTQALADWLLGSKSPVAGASTRGGPGDIVSKTLGSMFGISPLISGVMSLFGLGRRQEIPQPLVDFSLPASIKQEVGVAPDNSFTTATYGDNGLAKPEPRTVASSTQINVQVNAMDSRSFVDRSDDIARAVKEAMLHSHSLNDVVVDL